MDFEQARAIWEKSVNAGRAERDIDSLGAARCFRDSLATLSKLVGTLEKSGLHERLPLRSQELLTHLLLLGPAFVELTSRVGQLEVDIRELNESSVARLG